MNMPEVDGPRTIGFAAKRNISATDQSYGWPGYPQSSARFVSALNELEVLGVQPRAQISVIPLPPPPMTKQMKKPMKSRCRLLLETLAQTRAGRYC